ncbi:MAG: CHASE2 domain-containing protein, partial [Gammaproteobacteria bacterium]|nr:CHASE2 domain-containing protein [Gammaproteobacteria bacterium]
MNRLLKFGKRAIFANVLTLILVKIYSCAASYFRQYAPTRHVSPRYWDKWKDLPDFTRRLIGNMIVGLGVSLLLIALHDTPFHRGMEDAGLDWMMKMYSGTQPQKDAVPFAFLDIDDATYKSWGEPYFTPRGKTLDLLRFSLTGNPAIVIIDIDLSRMAGSEDNALVDFIQNYPADRVTDNKQQPDNPPIILSRVFRPAADGVTFEIRPSFLDSSV